MKANINYVTWYSIKVFFIQSSILVWGIIEFYIKWLSNQIIFGTGFRTVVHLLYSNIFIDSKPLKCMYNNEACFESRFLVIDMVLNVMVQVVLISAWLCQCYMITQFFRGFYWPNDFNDFYLYSILASQGLIVNPKALIGMKVR